MMQFNDSTLEIISQYATFKPVLIGSICDNEVQEGKDPLRNLLRLAHAG